MIKKHNNNLFSVEVPNGISIITGKAGIEALEEAIRNKFKEENMESIKIDVELINLKHETVISGKAFIELRNKTLRYKAFFESRKPIDTEDPSLGERDSRDEWDLFIKKDVISGVELTLGTPKDFDEYWIVSIVPDGRGSDLDIYFKFEKKAEAIKLQRDILTWMFGEEY